MNEKELQMCEAAVKLVKDNKKLIIEKTNL